MVKVERSGFDEQTGGPRTESVRYVRCRKLRALGRVRNLGYDRDNEGFGHTYDRIY